jgi:hypothetical protein
MDKDILDINMQRISQIDISPSQVDDLLGKACPCAQGGNEPMSSMWTLLHQIFNARLAKDLKKSFAKINVQHEVVEGNSRLDIRLIAEYQSKVIVGEKNIAVIDLKTGGIKLYQLCLYAVRNQCPAIIVELHSGDVHVITPEAASKILEDMPSELEKTKELRNFSATLPGQDCKFCSRECKDRITKYSPYKVSSTTFEERTLELEANYNGVRDKLQEILRSLILKAKVKALAEAKTPQSSPTSPVAEVMSAKAM